MIADIWWTIVPLMLYLNMDWHTQEEANKHLNFRIEPGVEIPAGGVTMNQASQEEDHSDSFGLQLNWSSFNTIYCNKGS